MLSEYGQSQNLCGRCSKINLSDPISLSELQTKADSCNLCNILSHCLERHGIGKRQKIELLKSRRIVVRTCAAKGRLISRYFSICIRLADHSIVTKPEHLGIQFGFPVLPDGRGPIHFELLREWLQFCDERHESLECAHKHNTVLPTRVVDVGDKDSGFLRLYYPAQPKKAEYLALSHCWGKLEEKDKFCTSLKNVDDLCRGFSMNDLPQTFKDAVTVTRELGKRYLWIDSLCIIQDDPNDWAFESKRMEAVFSNAYCTIAASAAADSTVGFLTRRHLPQYVEIPNSAHGQIYICEAIDDFYRDVEEGVLSQRAWVLQERALSRRTIHFTASQLYWECGDGVRCETLTHMRK